MFDKNTQSIPRQTTLVQCLTSHSCLTFAFSRHDTTANKEKKKKTSCYSGLLILSGLIYPSATVLHLAPKENSTFWLNIKATQSRGTAEPTGFPVSQDEHGNGDVAAVNMGKDEDCKQTEQEDQRLMHGEFAFAHLYPV